MDKCRKDRQYWILSKLIPYRTDMYPEDVEMYYNYWETQLAYNLDEEVLEQKWYYKGWLVHCVNHMINYLRDESYHE